MAGYTNADGSNPIKPPYTTALTNTPRYHADGATVTDDMMNMLMMEVINAIIILGLAVDYTDDGQLAEAVKHVRGIRSSLADFTGSTLDLKALVAASGESGGSYTAVLGSQDGSALGGGSGAYRAIAGALRATIDEDAFAGLVGASVDARAGASASIASAVIASKGDTADGTSCANAGNQSAIIASQGVAAGKTTIASGAVESAILGCSSVTIAALLAQALAAACEGTTLADGDHVAALASAGGVINTTGGEVGLLATELCQILAAAAKSAIVAAQNCDINSSGGSNLIAAAADAGGNRPGIKGAGNVSAIVACAGEVEVTGTECAALACDDGPGGPVKLSGTRVAAVAVDGNVDVQGTNTVTMASSWGGAGIVLGAGDNNKVVLGDTAGGGVGPSLRTNVTDAVTGGVLADAAYVFPGADYAECFKNGTGAPIAPGTIVTYKPGGVRPAEPGDRVLGVVSVNPTVVGNAAPLHWQGLLEQDEWGGVKRDKDGHGIASKKLDAERHASGKYQGRLERPSEWTLVGLLGQVHARVAKGVRSGDLLGPGPGGVGEQGAGEGRPVEVLEIIRKATKKRGCAIALCMVG